MQSAHDYQKWPSIVDDLQSQGRYAFSRREVEILGRRSGPGLQAGLRRLKEKGRIASPRRGFYTIVPLEYRKAGGIPPAWYIEDLMRFIDQPYYVALISAAALHGAAHQQPTVFQVMTDRPTRAIHSGRNHIEFHTSIRVGSTPIIEVQTETGSMRVSTPEATAFDLVHYSAKANHLGHIATILDELAEVIDSARLAELAESYPAPDGQRLGYFLETLGKDNLLHPLAEMLSKKRCRPIPLSPGHSSTVAKASKWNVIPNAEIDSDA